MEAKAEAETHIAAGARLKEDRERYKEMYEQCVKEKKSVLERFQNCEGKLAAKSAKIRKLLMENCSNSRNNNNDCRVIGAMKETVEELTDELRMKDQDIEQLRHLVEKLDTRLQETEEDLDLAKEENQRISKEAIERMRDHESLLCSRDALIVENSKLKTDMTKLTPKPDVKKPRKSSEKAEFDRLTEKLQKTEAQLMYTTAELRRMTVEVKKKGQTMAKIRKEVPRHGCHNGTHRNCLLCKMMHKLDVEFAADKVDCQKCGRCSICQEEKDENDAGKGSQNRNKTKDEEVYEKKVPQRVRMEASQDWQERESSSDDSWN